MKLSEITLPANQTFLFVVDEGAVSLRQSTPSTRLANGDFLTVYHFSDGTIANVRRLAGSRFCTIDAPGRFITNVTQTGAFTTLHIEKPKP